MQDVEITLSDGTVVKMRRPKVKDTLAVAKISNVGEQEVALIANLTMQTVEDISELYLDDYALLQNELKRFLSPEKKSS
ncbi:phage tail assembly protein [Sulfurospirillum cavolei]|uniref:phage tail assembly protein n=1 Tax=Sulfurospirillum cavolei TaxID=366522 RepID=UPI000764B640|nr:phage tail assembly protein [Sulfurospirillum cavolei]